jgi:sugar/nucleoside kinase (ribokinase family)
MGSVNQSLSLSDSETPSRDIDVLVVGDSNPDLILTGDVVPRFGQSEQLLDGADLTIGGSAAIVAHGLARLGLRVTMVAVVGADTFGELSRSQLSAAGVDVSPFQIDPELPTGLSVILVHQDTRTMLTLIGSIGALDQSSIGDDLLARARHLHASSFYLQPTLAAGLPELFARAHRAGVTTSLDTNLDPAGLWAGLDDVLPVTDILLPNRTEVIGIAGGLSTVSIEDAIEPDNPAGRRDQAAPNGRADVAESAELDGSADMIAAARLIAARGPLVVVKDGDRGAVIVSGDSEEVLHQKVFPVDAVDTTGAGDSFDAGFLAARLNGRPLAEALALACRAGALSTRGIGGTPTQATYEELLAAPNS